MVTLFSYQASGNCYKVRLLLSQLRVPFEIVDVDLKAGKGKTDAFRAKFPLGRVPVVELDDGKQLAESNAILLYFAEGSALVPPDRFDRARMLQWMFWEQYSHEPYVAVARAWISHFGIPPGKEKELEERIEKGRLALDTMERHLAKEPFFAAGRYSLADIALYAYTHVAEEGRFDLSKYPSIRAWLDRVKGQPGHVTIEQRP